MLVAGAALAISAALLVGRSDLESYRGLSGIDSALFVAVCARYLRDAWNASDGTGAALPMLLLVGFAGKLAAEALGGNALFVVDAQTAPLVWIAHGVGAATACLAASLPGARGRSLFEQELARD